MNQEQIDTMIKSTDGVSLFCALFKKADEVEKPYLYHTVCGSISILELSAFSKQLSRIEGYVDAVSKMQQLRKGEFGNLAKKTLYGLSKPDELVLILKDNSMPDWLKYCVKQWNKDNVTLGV